MNETILHERRNAIHLMRAGQTPAEVSKRLHRSLAWVYKWRKRYFEHGNWDDLEDRSRAPKRNPNKLPERVLQGIRQGRSELEVEANVPGKLSYIGAPAIQARLRRKKVKPLPSISSIERELRSAGMTRPRKSKQKPAVTYPRLSPTEPHQLIQVDIVTHYLPKGPCVACFNGIDVVSHYPIGQQYARRRSVEAVDFLIQVWQQMGIPQYTQADNEGCFSGGFTHKAVLGKVLRLAFFVGTELVFSPFYHAESNYMVERFHQDYDKNVWKKFHLPDLETVRLHSPGFFETYRQSEHIATLSGLCPAQLHAEQPVLRLPADFRLPKKLPLTTGKVHFMRRVERGKNISLLNLKWEVSQAKPDQGVWATLEFSKRGANLRIFDAAPDAPNRSCLAKHPFPLKEQVHPLMEIFQRPIPVEPSWLSLATSLFRMAVKDLMPVWISTIL